MRDVLALKTAFGTSPLSENEVSATTLPAVTSNLSKDMPLFLKPLTESLVPYDDPDFVDSVLKETPVLVFTFVVIFANPLPVTNPFLKRSYVCAGLVYMCKK